MGAFELNNPVILFDHSEYGRRFLFKKGAVNPRDELGKNGVTVHSRFSSLFYRTIAIEATLIDEKGQQKSQVFYVNRNSLIKYLGSGVKSSSTDEEITTNLQQKLEAQNDSEQANHSHLRHAGLYNQQA